MGRRKIVKLRPERTGAPLTRGNPPAAEPATPIAAGSAALQVIARLVTAQSDPATLSGAVASGLAKLLPDSSVAVVSIEPIRPIVRTLATDGAATLIVPVDRTTLPDVILAGCARRPLSVVSTAGAVVSGSIRLEPGAIDQATLLSIAVPVGASSIWVLLLALPAASVNADTVENLRVFGNILRSVLREFRRAQGPEDIDEAIRRAKDEWELTVDALPHIVCLLDTTGRVLRCNRAVERWSLGAVTEVLGRNYHDLLHPRCTGPCPLLNGVTLAFERMQSERRRAYEFQVVDRRLARVVKVRVGRMPGCDGAAQRSVACAVLVVQDVTEFEAAKHRLAAMTQGLEVRVEERTRELADANRELQGEIARRIAAEESLREKSDELAALSEGLMDAQEQERKRISRELHDSVGQSLNALKYGLERAAELERQGLHAGTRDALEQSIATTQETMSEVRGIAHNLRPSVLDNLGAASAVGWFSRAFATSYPELQVVANIALRDDQIPTRLATTIFRGVQEMLNNVARHARARRVDVSLRLDGERVVLEVRDDGVGLLGSAHAPVRGEGQGMRNLRERAQLSGGTFELADVPTGGAVARMDWVLAPGEAGPSPPGKDGGPGT